MAFGVLEKLRALGIACPGKISVMGYDDERGAQFSRPPLTTIRVPLYEMAKEGTRSLVEHLKQNGHTKKHFIRKTLLPVTLVERGSVKDSNSSVPVRALQSIPQAITSNKR